tara:strand:+ start:4443 stop:4952 length:510 start_codon:yes stop_codon:yes gene_type:complete
MLALLNSIDRFIHRFLEAMCSLLLTMMVGFTIYNVVMRYVFENPPVWGDLLTVLSNIWLMFIALSLTARDNEHIALNLIYEKLPAKLALYVRQFWKLMIIIVGLVLIVYGIELVEGMRGKYWEMWHFAFTENGIEFKENYMPKKYAVTILPLAGFLTSVGAAICLIKKI